MSVEIASDHLLDLLITELERLLSGQLAYKYDVSVVVGVISSIGGVARLAGCSRICLSSRYFSMKSVSISQYSRSSHLVELNKPLTRLHSP